MIFFGFSKHTVVHQREELLPCDAEGALRNRAKPVSVLGRPQRQWCEADLGGVLQDEARPAQRRGGRSQAEGRVSGVQRVPLVASAEGGERARGHHHHRRKGGLPRATDRGRGFWRRHGRAGTLRAHRGGLWGPGKAQVVKIKGAEDSLQHALGALSALWRFEEGKKTR